MHVSQSAPVIEAVLACPAGDVPGQLLPIAGAVYEAFMDASERNKDIIEMYLMGKVLREIGEKYGLTRERVRQIISRAGVSSTDGGSALKSRIKSIDAAARKDREYLAKYGCTFKEYIEIRDSGGTRAYGEQKRNAKTRGIDFSISLKEWWNIWADSGKWEMRGRGYGKYVMARNGDTGPYAIGNVRIITTTDNIKERNNDYLRYAPRFGPRTHCYKGHPFVDGNIIYSRDGKRRCKTCAQIGYKRRKERHDRGRGFL